MVGTATEPNPTSALSTSCPTIPSAQHKNPDTLLYAAGYAGGQRAHGGDPSSPTPVNLLQQTPLDKSFNDLVIGRDRCFILEFKRSLDKVATEKSKWGAKELAYFQANKPLQLESMCGHLVVYGQPSQEGVGLRVCFYLDALGLTREPTLDRGSAQRLIDKLHGVVQTDKLEFGLPPRQLLAYLKALRILRHGKESSGGRSSKESAWVGVAKNGDAFVYRTANSLGELLGIEPAPEPEPERNLDRESPSLG